MQDFIDYYKILQIDPSADAETIRRAYQQMMRQFHPDKGGDTEYAKLINEAYRVLSNPRLREQYDRRYSASGQQRRQNNANRDLSQLLKDLFAERRMLRIEVLAGLASETGIISGLQTRSFITPDGDVVDAYIEIRSQCDCGAVITKANMLVGNCAVDGCTICRNCEENSIYCRRCRRLVCGPHSRGNMCFDCLGRRIPDNVSKKRQIGSNNNVSSPTSDNGRASYSKAAKPHGNRFRQDGRAIIRHTKSKDDAGAH